MRLIVSLDPEERNRWLIENIEGYNPNLIKLFKLKIGEQELKIHLIESAHIFIISSLEVSTKERLREFLIFIFKKVVRGSQKGIVAIISNIHLMKPQTRKILKIVYNSSDKTIFEQTYGKNTAPVEFLFTSEREQNAIPSEQIPETEFIILPPKWEKQSYPDEQKIAKQLLTCNSSVDFFSSLLEERHINPKIVLRVIKIQQGSIEF
jgi:hypothetical protein